VLEVVAPKLEVAPLGAVALAVKVAPVAPAITDTVDGAPRFGLSLVSDMLMPGLGAADDRLTEQFDVAGGVTVVGAQSNPLSVGVGVPLPLPLAVPAYSKAPTS